MGPNELDDPFDWDVNRVIAELCSPNRTWTPTRADKVPDKPPDSTKLTNKLLDLELDGQSLLTHEGNEFPLINLFVGLEIKKIPHQLSVGEAIRQFKGRSTKYQQWKREQTGDLGKDANLGETRNPEIVGQEPISESRSADDNGGSSSLSGVVPGFASEQGLLQRPLSADGQQVTGDQAAHSALSKSAVPTTPDIYRPEASSDQPPPSKKRRIAPTTLSTIPSKTTLEPIPTEADVVMRTWGQPNPGLTNSDGQTAETRPQYSYLGKDGLAFKDMFDPDLSSDEESEGGFSFVRIGDRRPGRDLQVHRAMKKYLSQHLTLKDFYGSSNDSGDKELPLFGESDEEYDSETWQQYEEEELERQEEEARKRLEEDQKTYLQQEQVEATISEAIQEYEDRWNEEKRPLQLLRASKLWNDARRYKTRLLLLSAAAKFCRQLDARIVGIRQQILKQQWPDRESLHLLMKDVLQPSIRDRMAERLKIKILNSPVEPIKPSKLPQAASRRHKSPAVVENEDEDILASDLDEDLEQFVVHDSEPDDDLAQFMVEDSMVDDLMDIDSGLPGGMADVQDGDSLSPASHDRQEEPQSDLNSPSQNFKSREDSLSNDNISLQPEPTSSAGNSGANDSHLAFVTSLEQGVQTTPAGDVMDDDSVDRGDMTRPATASRAGADEAAPDPMSREPTPRSEQDAPSQDTPPEIEPVPSSDDIAAIASLGVDYWSADHWEDEVENQRGLLIAILAEWPKKARERLLKAVESDETTSYLWQNITWALKGSSTKTKLIKRAKSGAVLAQLFLAWLNCRSFEYQRIPIFSRTDTERIMGGQPLLDRFRKHVQSLVPGFRGLELAKGPELKPTVVSLREAGDHSAQQSHASERDSNVMDDPGPTGPASDDMEDAPATPKSTRSFDDKMDELAGSDGSEDLPISPSKRKRRRVIRDSRAANIREINFQQEEEFENRRRALRNTLAHTGSLSGDRARFIINETKEEEHGFIYVAPSIAEFIKPHQVDGVRFMWNQIVAKSKTVRKGCLLAHTMGLGKTMQVITLLYAIAEASSSEDQAVYGQIPEELRVNKTLILCPAGLVDNWHDELLKWTPVSLQSDMPLGLLGCLYKIESAQPQNHRMRTVNKWAKTGGVLVVGYEMLRTFFNNTNKDSGDDSMIEASSEVWDILLETPNIVIADEAHSFKNPGSQVHAATSRFRTSSRIALTGTPLANNVGDYYQMIDWISPTYLGPPKEFKAYFENPIRDGLWADDAPAMRRNALKRLSVLKSTVAPLIHRMSILALKDDLPQKKEFILYLDWTPVQRKAYTTFLNQVVHNPEAKDMITAGNTMRWSFVRYLGTILAHPWIYGKKLREKPANARKATSRSPAVDGEAASGEEENALKIPHSIQKILLATAPDSIANWQDKNSRKVVVLTHIIDECRRVKDKVLVFSHHIATLDFLEAMFKRQKRNYYRLDGSTKISTRQGATKDFNTDDNAEIYLISTRAGGVGLNIQGANRVVIFDFEYVPMQEQQAIGRAYRIGQGKPVFVYWLIVGGTFEESIQNRSVFKMQLQARVVDKKKPLPWAQRNKTLFPAPRKLPQEDLSEFSGRDAVLDAVLASKALQGSVRKIIATEAFEEEVKDDELNAEDRKEIECLLAQHKFRLANPGAAAAGVGFPGPSNAASQMPTLMPGIGQPGPAYPHPAPYGQGYVPVGTIFKLAVPPHLRTNVNPQQPQPSPTSHGLVPMALPSNGGLSSHIPQSQPPGPAQARALPVVSTDASGSVPLIRSDPSNPAVSSAIHGPSALHASPNANPQAMGAPEKALQHAREQRFNDTSTPITGSGTQIGAPKPKMGLPGGGKDAFGSIPNLRQTKQKRVEELLMEPYRGYANHSQRDIMTPYEVVSDIHRFLEMKKLDGLVMVDFYATLITQLESSSRLQEALLFGVIGAKELTDMGREEARNLASEYQKMDETAFKRRVSEAINETSRPKAILPKSSVSPPPSRPLSQVPRTSVAPITPPERKHRPLPTWARQAVASGTRGLFTTPFSSSAPQQKASSSQPSATQKKAGDSLDNALIID